MRSVLSFIFCIFIAGFLAYLITGTGGIFVLTLLVFALVFDLVLTFVSSKNLKISLELSSDILNKGDKLEAVIKSKNSSFMPSGIIQAEIACSPHLSTEGETVFRFITAGERGEPVRIPVTADFSGAGSVYIKDLAVYDFLGMRKRAITAENGVCVVNILPKIPDTGIQGEVIKSVSDSTVFDDSEEESDETSLVPTGIAGYEHRPYVPGDPLKRINWKISSKKNSLMVRLDDKSVTSSHIFRLDIPKVENVTRDYIKTADHIAEASLAMLFMLVRQGFESEYNVFIDDVWETVKVGDEKDVRYLQERLAKLSPYPPQKRIPPASPSDSGKGLICFTSCSAFMEKELGELLENFSGAIVSDKSSGIQKQNNIEVWTVDENCQFEKL